jgi:S1-C subfamily serine protease
VLVGIAGRPIASVADLHRALGSDAIGVELALEILRAGRPERLAIRPVEARGTAARPR